MDKVIVYYTDNTLDINIANACQKQLTFITNNKIPIVCVSQERIDFGDFNMITGHLDRSRHSMFKQIYAGLIKAWQLYHPRVVCMAEHDVLYPDGWFDFNPNCDNTFYYSNEKWFINKETFFYKSFPCLSTLICNFKLLLSHITLRLYRIEKLNKKKGGWTNSEPGVSVGDSTGEVNWYYPLYPCIDIRHGTNLSKISVLTHNSQLTKSIKYWGDHSQVKKLLGW